MEAKSAPLFDQLFKTNRKLVFEFLDELDKNVLMRTGKYFHDYVNLNADVIKVFKFFYEFHYNYLYTYEDLLKFAFYKEDLVDKVLEKFKTVQPVDFGKAVGLYFNFWHSRVKHTKQVNLTIRHKKYEEIMKFFFQSLRKFFTFSLDLSQHLPSYYRSITKNFHKVEIDLRNLIPSNLEIFDLQNPTSIGKLIVTTGDRFNLDKITKINEFFKNRQNKLTKLNLFGRISGDKKIIEEIIKYNCGSLTGFHVVTDAKTLEHVLEAVSKCLLIRKLKIECSNHFIIIDDSQPVEELNTYMFSKINNFFNLEILTINAGRHGSLKVPEAIGKLQIKRIKQLRFFGFVFCSDLGTFIKNQKELETLEMNLSIEDESSLPAFEEVLSELPNLTSLHLQIFCASDFNKQVCNFNESARRWKVSKLQEFSIKFGVTRSPDMSFVSHLIKTNINLKSLSSTSMMDASEECVAYYCEMDKVISFKVTDELSAAMVLEVAARHLENVESSLKHFFHCSFNSLMFLVKTKGIKERVKKVFFENVSELTLRINCHDFEDDKICGKIGHLLRNINDLRIMKSIACFDALKRILNSFGAVERLKYLKFQEVANLTDEVFIEFLEKIKNNDLISISLRELSIGKSSFEKIAEISGEMASFKNLIFVENKSDTEDDKKTATSLLEKIVTKDNFFAIQINKQDFENEEELLGLVEKYKHIKFVMV